MEYLLYFNILLMLVLASILGYAICFANKSPIFGGVSDLILIVFYSFRIQILLVLLALWVVYFIFR